MQTISTQGISRRQARVMASRPQTLPAAAAPVVIDAVVAIHVGLFVPLPAFAALVGAFLIKAGINFANDYYDTVQSADTETQKGFTCVIAGGLIPLSEVRRAMYLIFAAAVLLGTYLVYVGGVPVLVVGPLSVAPGIIYIDGPHPLGYRGLSGLFVFILLNLAAVTDTSYVQAASVLAAPLSVGVPTGTIMPVAVLASLSIAAISTNILVVNNVRDKEEDTTTGKRTFAIQFGRSFARAEYVTMLALAYAVPVYLQTCTGFDWFVLLPVFSTPVAARITRVVVIETGGKKLNPAFEDTEKLLAFYAILFSIGLALM